MDLIPSGVVLTENLADGYSIQHSVIGSFESGHGISLTSFHRCGELLLHFMNSSFSGRIYSIMFASKHMTEEWFVDQLIAHPPLFDWFLFHPEIFESKK